MLAAILILAAALRVWGLGSKSFWVDEILAVERSRSLRQAVAYCAVNHEPPLRYCLLHYLARFNPPELFTRLPSFVFGLATVALLWWLARMLFGARAGTVAAFLLAVSFWHIVQSQDARMYPVMMFFWTLSLIIFFHVLEQPSQPLWWPALAIVHAANFYLSYLTVFVLMAEALTFIGWLIVRKWREREAFALRPYATGALIFVGFFALCISFWFNPIVSLIERYTGARATGAEPLVRAVHAGRETVEIVGWPAEFDAKFLLGILDKLLIPGIAWRIVTLIGLSVGLSLCWRRNRPFVLVAVLAFFLPMVAILFTEMRHFVAPRYVFHLLLFAIIAFAVVLVTGAEAIVAYFHETMKKRIAVVFLAAIATVSLARYFPILMLHARCERQDWRTACRWIAENAKPPDVILTGPWGTYGAVLYYGSPALTEHYTIANCLSADRTADEIERPTADANVWYVAWGYMPDELKLVIEERLEKALALSGLDGTIEIFQRKRPQTLTMKDER